MLNLPTVTEINSVISNEALFEKSAMKPIYRLLYSEQVRELWWRNKLSEQNYGFENTDASREIEVFETKLHFHALDKRILREIDNSTSNYILHILTSDNRHRILISNKRITNSSVLVDNYLRSRWLNDSEMTFDFSEKTADRLYESLRRQIMDISTKVSESAINEECVEFRNYLHNMAMTRSYKPILVIATIQNGGQISVTNAINFFRNFYFERRTTGLPIESGACVYSDPDSTDKEMEDNLIKNPVAALCRSGFFKFNPSTQEFSLVPEIYDGLTVNEIDWAVQICKSRISDYFGRK